MIAPPPGVDLMTLGDVRREFPDRGLGKAVRAWGDSPALPRAPDDSWCWVLDGGIEVRCRFETAEDVCRDAWRILWWVLTHHKHTTSEQKRELRDAHASFMQEMGLEFPEGYKDSARKITDHRLKQKKGTER